MKISQKTLSILKNFSSIQKSIVIKQGNVIKTISGEKNLFARALVNESFPTQFSIYELSKFLGAISLFDDPDFEFFDDHLKISEKKNFIRYTYADESLIVTPPDKEIQIPSKDIYFELTEKDFSGVLKAASVLQAPEITVVGEDGTIYVKANNNSNASADSYSIAVGVTDASFNMIFKSEHFKFINGAYKVNISAKGIGEFVSDAVTYWIATESKSKFGV